MTITTAAAVPDLGANVIYLDPDDYLDWFGGKLTQAPNASGELLDLAGPWVPGQHVALVGRTREGKTNFALWIMGLRSWVLALDPKGEDDTLTDGGYERVRVVPPFDARAKISFADRRQWRGIDDRIAKGLPVRIIAGLQTRTRKQDDANRGLMEAAIEYVRQVGHWTFYVDEYQILADTRMYGLGRNVERMLISAARDKVSVITAFQAPAWVPKASTRQATIIVCWRTRDRRMIQTVAEAAGRDWKEVAAILDELPKYYTLTLPDDLRAPMVITKPPKISGRGPQNGGDSPEARRSRDR